MKIATLARDASSPEAARNFASDLTEALSKFPLPRTRHLSVFWASNPDLNSSHYVPTIGYFVITDEPIPHQ